MKEVNNDIQPSTSTTDANRPIKNEANKRKRRASDAAESNLSAKRFIAPAEEDDGVFKLLDFTDEVLLEILQNCESTTLYALSKTCKHFLKLVEDRRLWKTFDFATKRMMGRQIKKLLSALQIGDINEFKVRGFVTKYPSEKWKNNTITVKVLRKLSSSCQCLETIEIREGYINFQKVKISDFPATLKHLIFYGCQITLPRSPRLFTKIDEYLQLLEEISLEKCPWFETHDLVVFSKLPHLKRLNLRGCSTLKGCVPYGSIATRFGFKSLEYLDVRDTPISDSDIQCFNITSTLREIKMDCPAEFRENYISTDETPSDTDDSESYEPKPRNNDSTDESAKHLGEKSKHNSNSNKETHRRDDSIVSESESESEDESDCSTDSEDGNSDGGEDGGAKVSSNNDDANAPHQAHCIQVILQNGRMINVNAERSNEFDSPIRETNGLHCVIGIINGRDSNDRVFAAPLRCQRQSGNQHQSADNQSQNESNAPSTPKKCNHGSSSSSSEKSKSPQTDSKNTATISTNTNANTDGGSQPGPSGLQTNQNDSIKAAKSNSQENANANANTDNNANDEAGPSNRQQPANPPNENRQRLIIVQHRRSPNNDENGNMNRQISWEVRNLYPIADAPYRTMRYHNTMLNGSGNYITDRGMCSFGMPRHNVQENIIWIRAELRPPDTLLERITVRNYLDVTDVTLRHLALCAPNLRYLDVTGTSVTLKGITTFLKEKPDCQIISELLDT